MPTYVNILNYSAVLCYSYRITNG